MLSPCWAYQAGSDQGTIEERRRGLGRRAAACHRAAEEGEDGKARWRRRGAMTRWRRARSGGAVEEAGERGAVVRHSGGGRGAMEWKRWGAAARWRIARSYGAVDEGEDQRRGATRWKRVRRSGGGDERQHGGGHGVRAWLRKAEWSTRWGQVRH
jgi:hypothetical protein